MGLLPSYASIEADRLTFDGIDLLRAIGERLPQDPRTARRIDPAGPEILAEPGDEVGKQIAEAWRVHKRGSRAAARRETLRLLEQVQDPRSGEGGEGVSARAFGRHGPARDDRHDAGARPGTADRGRTDQRTGCDGAGGDPATDRAPGVQPGHGPDPDQPRPAVGFAFLRPRDGDVRRPRDGGDRGR